MVKLDDLKKMKEDEIYKKNQILSQKWAIEDEINNLQNNKSSYFNRGNYLAINEINSKKRQLDNRLYHIKRQLENIDHTLNELDVQIKDKELKKLIAEKDKEFKEINNDYISNQNLSKKDIKNLKIQSENISKNFNEVIENYSLFQQTVDFHLKEIRDNYFWIFDLNKLKKNIETKIEELLNYQEKSMHFKYLDKLSEYISNYNDDLEKMKTNFVNSKKISLEFDVMINQYQELLDGIDLQIIKLHEKFLNDDFELMKNKLDHNILFLLKNQKRCYNFENFDKLKVVLNETKDDFERISFTFNKSIKILKKFESENKGLSNFLKEIDYNIDSIKDNISLDDLNKLKVEIGTKQKKLLNYFEYQFEFEFMDEISEELSNTRKWRKNWKHEFGNSQNILNDFDSTIKNYSNFLIKVDNELDVINEKYDGDDFKNIVINLETKKEKLLKYQKKCFEFKSFDELNQILNTANNDLIDMQRIFKQIKTDLYVELKNNSINLINEKLDICSKLNSKVSILINDTNELGNYIEKKELLINLNEINTNLTREFKNLTEIKNNLDQNTTDIQFNKESLNILNLENMLTQISFEDFEKIIFEQEELYEKISYQNKNMNEDDVRKLLDEFDKCFNKPMFKHQLKRYNLKEKELDIVKNDIINDILNKIIVECSDFKQIIKTRCNEFRKTHSEFDENELDNLLDINNFNEFDEEIIIECRNLVKQDILKGNLTKNNVNLKFNKYLNKKLDESKQLKELEEIKNNPSNPSIKIHLSQEENNEIYDIVKTEIISEYGIRDSVETRVYYWCNQKIRENQSNARGRLNIIKRDFSNLTQLNLQQQNEFIIKIEYLINENKIKLYEITEENIIGLSDDFIHNKL